jgi:Cytochrome P450
VPGKTAWACVSLVTPAMSDLADLYVSLTRMAKENFTFSNGFKIPKGNLVCTLAYTVHENNDIYKDAHEFRPCRFASTMNIKQAATCNNILQPVQSSWFSVTEGMLML